jgi:DNA-binding CsgD family transcriptional regulator
MRSRPQEALAHSERARAGGRLLAERGAGGWASPQLLAGYILADEIDTAYVVCGEVEAAAQSSGSVFGLITAITYHAWVDARRGALTSAEAVLGRALDLAEGSGMLMWLTTAAFLLVDVLTERSHDSIVRVVEETDLPADFLATASGAMLLEARGRMRMVRHEREAAIADLRAAGEINGALGFGPPWSLWRSSLALALPREEREEARELATKELALARSTGLNRPTGIALRTLGLLSDSAEGVDLLGESVTLLQDSPARLELARSLVELGGMLRRANRRTEARERLVDGLRLAHECGAQRLSERADQELKAWGGRRPRLLVAGPDALTASELRVATLASAGATNTDIAGELYVSVKTVETHLSRAYGKLGLAGPGSRGRLARALSDSARRP